MWRHEEGWDAQHLYTSPGHRRSVPTCRMAREPKFVLDRCVTKYGIEFFSDREPVNSSSTVLFGRELRDIGFKTTLLVALPAA